MQTYQVLLIGNGEALPARYLRKLAKQANYILAADGGADKALKAGVEPDAVIGDLDSISTAARTHMGARVWHVPTQQNTDLEKAICWAVAHHITSMLVVGFVGDRWDFSIGNLLVLARYAPQLELAAVGKGWRLVPLTRSRQFDCTPGKRVSIIPLTTCHELTLAGLTYPLVRQTVHPGTTLTLSNQTTATDFCVSFTQGSLLVYQEL